MRWQDAARIGIAVVGLGVAVAIFLYTRSRPAPPVPPNSLAAVDPNASLEGGAGRRDYLRADRSPISISYQGIQTYDDGRTRLLGPVEIRGFEESRYTVRADMVETVTGTEAAERPSRYDLKGDVTVTTDDGLTLSSDTAYYDDAASRLTMEGRVVFRKGRISGESAGATYDREEDAVRLLDQAVAHIEADDQGRGRADATAARMTLNRTQNTLQMEDRVRIVGDDQTLSAARATITFDEAGNALKYVALRESARAVPTSPSGGQPSMEADNITMTFQADGVTLQHATLTGRARLGLGGGEAKSIRASMIDLFTAADGRTLTGLQAHDSVVVDLPVTATTPHRTISAVTLTATGTEARGLTSARFEGSPEFKQWAAPAGGAGAPAAPSRTGTATSLVLTLGGQIDAIEQAEFLQNARFQDGDITGWADEARYHEAKGRLVLSPDPKAPKRLSRVTTPDITIDGATIDVSTESQDVNAQGSVTTQSKPGRAATADATSMFDATKAINGAASTLEYRKSTGQATYRGSAGKPASLWQDESRVVGDTVVFADATRNLTATGTVDSRWFLSPSGGATGGDLKSYRVRADSLVYDESRRTAVYSGSPVLLTTDEGDFESDRLTFALAAASRALESMQGDGHVWVGFSDGYEASGEGLVYRAAGQLYTLEGKPARVRSPRESGAADTSTCTLTTSLFLELDRRTGRVTAPRAGQAPKSEKEVSCSLSLRRER
jgi:lipopolysaccharide export system protein LptA